MARAQLGEPFRLYLCDQNISANKIFEVKVLVRIPPTTLLHFILVGGGGGGGVWDFDWFQSAFPKYHKSSWHLSRSFLGRSQGWVKESCRFI